MNIHSFTKSIDLKNNWPFLLIFLIAFFLRAWQIDLVLFTIDESITSIVALQISELKRFPLYGIETSYGFHNPPLLLYLLAPFFAIANNPSAASIFIAFLGSTTTLLFARAGQLLAGKKLALIASILICVSPNAVEYSRRIWGHDFIIFCSAVCIWSAIEAHVKNKWQFLTISFISAGAAQCLHLSGVLLWFIPLPFLFSKQIPKRLLAIGLGFLLLFLQYLPWIISEFISNFEETKIILSHLTNQSLQKTLGIPINPFFAWSTLFSDSWYNEALGYHIYPWQVSQFTKTTGLLNTSFAIIFLITALAQIFTLIKQRKQALITLSLLISAILPVIIFGILTKAYVIPYLLPSFSPLLLLAAISLKQLLETKLKRVTIISIIIFSITSISLIISTRLSILNGYGERITLREKTQNIEYIKNDIADKKFLLLQNARQPQTGIDMAYIYINHWKKLSSQYTKDINHAEVLYIIINNRTKLHPEINAFLSTLNPQNQNHTKIYKLNRQQKYNWLNLVTKHPQLQK